MTHDEEKRLEELLAAGEPTTELMDLSAKMLDDLERELTIVMESSQVLAHELVRLRAALSEIATLPYWKGALMIETAQNALRERKKV